MHAGPSAESRNLETRIIRDHVAIRAGCLQLLVKCACFYCCVTFIGVRGFLRIVVFRKRQDVDTVSGKELLELP